MEAKHQHEARNGAADSCRHPAFADPPYALAAKGNRGDVDLAVQVGRNLRKLRTRRGQSLEWLAKLSDVSRAMLSRIERGGQRAYHYAAVEGCTRPGGAVATLTRGPQVHGTAVLRAAR
jgi:Helix-turn-helix domain